jgi:hypothetical protein
LKGVTTVSALVAGFSVQFLFPSALSSLGAAVTFSICATFAVIGLVLVAWLLPETRGRTLEQLEVELTGVEPDAV